MKVVIQRVASASVAISGDVVGSISQGLLLFIGFTHDDNNEDLEWMKKKITGLRIFSDEAEKMNLSIRDVAGEVLVVSQFTLHASTKKGNRPSFVHAARANLAEKLYEDFITRLRHDGITVATGRFGAMMKVQLMNDGPVTILMDSKNRV